MKAEKEIFAEPWSDPDLGCQMVSFQTKNPNLGKFSRDFYIMEKGWYFLVHFEYNTAFRTFYSHLAIWYISPSFGILRREKSGNPDPDRKFCPI
jgi:hypothetical protein